MELPIADMLEEVLNDNVYCSDVLEGDVLENIKTIEEASQNKAKEERERIVGILGDMVKDRQCMIQKRIDNAQGTGSYNFLKREKELLQEAITIITK